MSRSHSAGVILGQRAAGFHLYRDEIGADGGKRYLHKKARRAGRAQWMADYLEDSTEGTQS